MHDIIKNSCVFYDTETTGLNEDHEDKIIQLSAFYSDHNINVRIDQLFSSTKKIEYGAMAVHHITENMIRGRVPFHNSIQHKVSKFLNDEGRIFIAHNAKFDNQMMKQAGIEIKRHICTLKLAKKVLYNHTDCESYNLQYLRYYFGLEFDQEINAHDAKSDVIVLIKVFEKLFEILIDKELFNSGTTVLNDGTVEKLLKECEEISTQPSILRIMPFGKHKGKTFLEIAKKDYGYMTRYFGQASTDRDIIASMKEGMRQRQEGL